MLPVVMAAAALIALLAFAPFASAASDPLASGTTTLTLNKGFFKKLKKNDVKVLKVSPGTVNNRTVTLPVSGGSLDPTTGLGTVNVSGGIKFKNGKKQVPLKNLIFDSTTKFLTGTVGKKQMKIATLNGLSFVRNGFGVDVGVTKLRLTENAAKQLNKKLGFSNQSNGSHKRATTSSADSANVLFKKNQVTGSSASVTQPTTVAVLAQGNATLVPDPAGTFLKVPQAWESTRSPTSLRSPRRQKQGTVPTIFSPSRLSRWNARARCQRRNREQRRRHSDRQTGPAANTVQFTDPQHRLRREDGAGRQHPVNGVLRGPCLDRRPRPDGSDDHLRSHRKDDHRHRSCGETAGRGGGDPQPRSSRRCASRGDFAAGDSLGTVLLHRAHAVTGRHTSNRKGRPQRRPF